MNSFLDTSSLVKLYDHKEAGAASLQQQLDPQGIIYLSALTQVEFSSTLGRKQRRNELTLAEATTLQRVFEADYLAYGWIDLAPTVLNLATQLLTIHNTLALRSLDAIQLASALTVRADIQAFFTHDQRLRDAALAEGLPVR